MLEKLRTWLNGKRDYAQGATLYVIYGTNAGHKALFLRGYSPFSYKMMQDELMRIYKSSAQQPAAPVIISAKEEKPVIASERKMVFVPDAHPETAPLSSEISELYTAAKKRADIAYKNVMNKRAELFLLTKINGEYDINRPDLVEQRRKLAIEVVAGFQQVSHLYEVAGRVKNGDTSDLIEKEENEYDGIPDHLVKVSLDNLLKNYNKLIKREQTPERIALIQQHKMNIVKLEEKWRLLKPVR